MKAPIAFVKANHMDEEWKEGEKSFFSLMQAVEDCKLSGFDTATFSLNIWSLVHELCSLKLQGHLEGYGYHKAGE